LPFYHRSVMKTPLAPINNPGATHAFQVRPRDPAGQPARPSAQYGGDVGLSHARDLEINCHGLEPTGLTPWSAGEKGVHRTSSGDGIAMRRRIKWSLMTALLISVSSASAASALPSTDQEPGAPETLDDLAPVPVAGPFEFPWSIGFLPSGSFLVTEKPGRLRLIEPSATTEIKGLPRVRAGDQGGLLDIAVDPDFSRNHTVYLSYTHGTMASSTVRILKGRLDLTDKALVDQAVLFESDPPASANEQLGGRLTVTRDGYLFLSLGDHWEPGRAQDLSDHAGSIIRIHTDGSVPDTNPFISVPGAKPEIWSYGHRNPQGLVANEGTGQLWATEHGPQGGDELNLIQSGRNYGWPVISHGRNYDDSLIGSGDSAAPGMEAPVHIWVPSIAPSGLTVQQDSDEVLVWLGALAGQMVVRLSLGDNTVLDERRLLEGELGRIRDVRQGPDGFLYVLTDDPEGYLYRLAPATEVARQGGAKPPL
jgi:glucose/arabinose dehydrogenase